MKKKKKMAFVSQHIFQNGLGSPNYQAELFVGNRGKNYARYAEQFPDLLQVVGVAEPREHVRQYMQKKHSIPLQQ